MEPKTGLIGHLLRPRAASVSPLDQLILDTYSSSTTASGLNVTPDMAMKVGAVYACVLVLAQSVAQLPLHLYRRTDDRREKQLDHPLSYLMSSQPNAWMTSHDFKQLAMVHLLLKGNSLWFKARGSNGTVRELIPIHPDNLKGIHQDEQYRLTYEIGDKPENIEVYPAEKILHIRGFTLDGLQGVSPITYARESIGNQRAMDKHGALLFAQGARLGGILSHPGTLSKEAAERLKSSFSEAYAGEAGAHATAVLEEGMKWEKISMTAEDAQFLQSRQYQRSDIAGFFRVPAHMINDLEHATFSNIEHMSIQFVQHALMPWLVNIEQALQRDLLKEAEKLDHYFKFSVDGLLRGDSVSRSQSYQTSIMGGWMSPNEVRELEDRNPYEGGDDFRLPLNMAPVNGESENEIPQRED